MKNYILKPFLYELQALLKENRVDEAEKCVDSLIESLEHTISEEDSDGDEDEDPEYEGLFGFFGGESRIE